MGEVSAYSFYALFKNKGFVNVGISKNTAEFAVNSIKSKWHDLEESRYYMSVSF